MFFFLAWKKTALFALCSMLISHLHNFSEFAAVLVWPFFFSLFAFHLERCYFACLLCLLLSFFTFFFLCLHFFLLCFTSLVSSHLLFIFLGLFQKTRPQALSCGFLLVVCEKNNLIARRLLVFNFFSSF